MDMITKQKTYFWAFAVLVILNITILFLLWTSQPKNAFPPKMGEARPGKGFAPSALNLSAEQKKTFDSYSKQYFQSRDSLLRMINMKKKEMFDEVFKEGADNEKANKLAEEIGELNVKMEKAFFAHFSRLKNILNDEQLKTFQNMIDETVKPQFENRRQPPPFQRPEGGPPPFEGGPKGE